MKLMSNAELRNMPSTRQAVACLDEHAEDGHFLKVEPNDAADKTQAVVHQKCWAADILEEGQAVQGVVHQIAAKHRAPLEMRICAVLHDLSCDCHPKI